MTSWARPAGVGRSRYLGRAWYLPKQEKKTFKFFKSENKLFMKEKTLFMINFLFAN